MAQTIKLKRSSVAGNVPGSSDLSLGEIAVNTADGAVYIKKGNDDIVTVADAGILYIDSDTDNSGANQRVGIGTTLPSEKLDIVSAGSVNMRLNNTGNNVSLSIGAQSSAARITAGSGDRLGLGAGNTQDILNITSGGNIGIGTTSPSNKLTVDGDIRIRDSIASLFLQDTDGTNQVTEIKQSTGFTTISSRNNTSNGATLFTGYNGTASTEYARFDSSGNFLVGTTSAANSSAGFRAYSGGNGAFTIAGTALSLNRLSSDGEILNFQKDTTTVGSIRSFAGDLIIQTGITGLRFNDGADAIHPVIANGTVSDGATDLGLSNARFKDLHLSGTGYFGTKVGIGTTSPTDKLEVYGDGADTTIRIHEDAGTHIARLHLRRGSNDAYVENDGGLRIRTESTLTGTAPFNIINNGNVGIGTDSPLDLLHIKSSSTDARLILDAASGADPELKFFEAGNVKYTVGHDAATSKFVIGTTNVDTQKRFTINSSGAITFNEAFTFPTSDGSANQVLQTDGSGNLTFGTAAGGGVSISNNVNNRVLTGDGTNANAEANLTFDGSNLGLPDNIKAIFGSGNDFKIHHDASHTYLTNSTGNVYFQQTADDMDIVFQADDGSGGVATYFQLDGSQAQLKVHKNMVFFDNVEATFGDSADLSIEHNSAGDSVINNLTGDLYITNKADDGDVIFRSDDGSGGFTSYFYLDGGNTNIVFEKDLYIQDNKKAIFGTGSDLQIYHESSTSNSYISEGGAGSLYISANNLRLTNYGITESYLQADANGAVTLYYDGAAKLATKSDGVDITGELQADSLDIDGAADISGNATFAGEIYAKDSNSTTDPTIAFTGHTDSGLSIYNDGSSDYVNIISDGGRRAYFNTAGITSFANVYTGTSSAFRNYAGTWQGTTGIAGNGFYFLNTAGGNTTKAMELTHDGNATFGGTLEATSFSDGTISGITFIDEDSFSTNSATKVPTQQSIKAYVDAQVAGVVDSAPGALNTLNELAAALGDDASFSTTTSTALGNRLRVDTASQGLTGTQQANAITNLGITATKAELNLLDGVTATTTELNYTDGVTSNIQTQLNSKLNLSGGAMTGALNMNSNRLNNVYTLQLRNGELSDFNATRQMMVDANDGDSNVPAHGDYAGVSPFGIYFTGDGDSATTTLGSGLVKVWHTGHFNKAHIDYFVGLYNTGVTTTEYDYLDGVTSNIQTQLDAKLTSSSTAVTNKLPLAGGSMTGALNINVNGDALNLRSTTNAQAVRLTLSSDVPAVQIGHLEYVHSDNVSYGSGEALILGGTEATTTILADGKLMYKEGIYSKPASGTGAGTRKDANWDTAYGWGDHASEGYLTSFDITTQTDSKYLRSDTADTASGILTFTNTQKFLGNTFWQVSSSDVALQRADARDDNTTDARLHWYGLNATGGNTAFKHAWYDGSQYVNVDVANDTVTFGGGITGSGAIESTTGGLRATSSELIQRRVGGWTVPLQTVIYSGYNTNLGDYAYLKAPGNSTTAHGTLIVGDNSLYYGRSSIEIGGVTNDAETPLDESVAFKIDQGGDARFKTRVGIGVFPATNANANNSDTTEANRTAPLHIRTTAGGGAGTQVAQVIENYASDYGTTPLKLAIDFKGQDSNNGVNYARLAQVTVNDTDYGDNNEATSHFIMGMTQNANYAERFMFNASGHFGMGSTSAFHPTDQVNTGSFFKPDTNGKFLNIAGEGHGAFINLTSGTTTDSDQIGGLYFTRTSGAADAHKQVAGIDVIQAVYAPNNTLEGGTMRFFTKPSGSGVNVPRMTIDSNGQVSFMDSSGNADMRWNGTDLILNDNNKLKLGTSGDLEIYHDGSTSYILDDGVGDLQLRSNNRIVIAKSPFEYMADFNADGAVDLYYDNVKKFETTSAGVTVTGSLSATTKSFDIEHPSKKGMRLHHGVVEGPEHSVYVRGKSKEKVILLPDYWVDLIHEDTITVQLTAIGSGQDLYVEDIKDNKVYVNGDNYFYYIQAERKDIDRFEVEYEG